MSSAVGSVIIAAGQSVAKVYVIGAIGYAAVIYPKKAPLLPSGAVSTVARWSFNTLTIPLIFATIGSSVTIDTLGSYWSVLVGSFGVLTISFLITTLLAKIIPISNPYDFEALRIASTFPNIVALPILIFPSLCEYPVVYEAFGKPIDGEGEEDRAELFRQCVAQSNTMIFCYFFGWSLLFWSFGHPALMKAAAKKKAECQGKDELGNNKQGGTEEFSNSDMPSLITLADLNNGQSVNAELQPVVLSCAPITNIAESAPAVDDHANVSQPPSVLSNIYSALKQTFTSPPFVAMILAFAVGCITPVRELLFSQGGALRFLGAAMESLGQASSPISTMVVAASLVPLQPSLPIADDDKNVNASLSHDETHAESPVVSNDAEVAERRIVPTIVEESPIMSDPNFGPLQLRRRSSIHRFGVAIHENTVRALTKARHTSPEQRRLLVWFSLSRLILSPGLVLLAIVGLDCSGILSSMGVPDLAKLVLVVNAAVPGALIVVLLIKSDPELHETAAVVAKMYLPTYIFSIVTIAAWTALGLIVSIPDSEGNSFCSRYL